MYCFYSIQEPEKMLLWGTFNETLTFLISRDLPKPIQWKMFLSSCYTEPLNIHFSICGISLSQNILFCMKKCKYVYCSILGWLTKDVSEQTKWWLVHMCNPDAVGPAIIRSVFCSCLAYLLPFTNCYPSLFLLSLPRCFLGCSDDGNNLFRNLQPFPANPR